MNTRLLCFLLGLPVTLYGLIEFGFPYRASFFPGEPRLATPGLISLGVRTAGSIGKGECRFAPEEDRHRAVHSSGAYITANIGCHGYIGSMIVVDRLHDRRYSNSRCNNYRHGFSELFGGGAWCWCPSPHFDFIDFSCETGLLFPLFEKDQHTAWGSRLALSVGIFDWITAGIGGNLLFLFDHPGIQHHVNVFLKADHFLQGFSFLFGLTYQAQKSSPPQAPSWRNTTLHILMEYDLAQETHPHLPHISFFYNHLLSGKGAYQKLSLMGVEIGIDF
ncbi:MAG: hypothetical protein JW725_03275 [Candidatus Babeliaceae bacterium]|nr:hypothetical protein [Candidatus Babeliaceae bacterium]